MSTPVVVDASVAVKWLLDEPERELARRLRDRRLLAPELMLLECCNVIWRHVVRGLLLPSAVPEVLAVLRAVPLRFAPVHALLDEIVRYAVQLRHPVYDCVYLAVAVAEGVPVVTADRRFVQAVRQDREIADRIILLSELAH